MKFRFWLTSLVLLIALLLVACGAAPPAEVPGDSPESGPAQEEPAPEVEETETVAPEVEETETVAPEVEETEEAVGSSANESPSGEEAAAAIAQEAISHLSAQTGLSEEAMKIVSVEAQEWSSSALGCPQPGMMYMDVITPGFQIIIEAEGESFALHTNSDGSEIVVCNDPDVGAVNEPEENGEQAQPSLEGEAQQVARAATSYLASETGLTEEEISLVTYSEEMWADSSLGCPQPGMMYMQVITPGYRFIFEGGGQRYNLHTDREGKTLIICERPQS